LVLLPAAASSFTAKLTHAHDMQTSTVKWFDARKGYGFIDHPDDGEDVFVHYSNIQSEEDFKTLESGQRVRFEMDEGLKGLHAPEVVPLDEDEANTENGDTSAELDPADVDPTAKVDPSLPDSGSSAGASP
jgi:CspA family cold shock protein